MTAVWIISLYGRIKGINMNKKIVVLSLIAVVIFAVIIFAINITIKKYGTETLGIKTSPTQVGMPQPSGEMKEIPKEEPEREPAQSKGPLLY